MESDQTRMKAVLTNLTIERNTRKGWTPSAEDRDWLIDRLEDALIDRDDLRTVLAHLQALGAKGGTAVVLNDGEVAAVLSGGLSALHTHSPERFYLAAADPLALLSLRDEVLETLPPYWLNRIRSQGGRELRTAEEVWKTAVAQADRGLALATLDAAAGPRRQVVSVPAEAVERVGPADIASPTIEVELILTQGPGGAQLDLELLNPPLLAASRWSGRLFASGVEIGLVEDSTGILSFVLPESGLPPGSNLHCDCDFWRGKDNYVRFRVRVPSW